MEVLTPPHMCACAIRKKGLLLLLLLNIESRANFQDGPRCGPSFFGGWGGGSSCFVCFHQEARGPSVILLRVSLLIDTSPCWELPVRLYTHV